MASLSLSRDSVTPSLSKATGCEPQQLIIITQSPMCLSFLLASKTCMILLRDRVKTLGNQDVARQHKPSTSLAHRSRRATLVLHDKLVAFEIPMVVVCSILRQRVTPLCVCMPSSALLHQITASRCNDLLCIDVRSWKISIQSSIGVCHSLECWR